MTHEYVVAVGGVVPGSLDADGRPATAIAWAADRILAIGADGPVRAISRGDSTFLDLAGCVVTALEPTVTLEPGARANLVFWPADATGSRSDERAVAVLREGVFTAGDPRRGPFESASA